MMRSDNLFLYWLPKIRSTPGIFIGKASLSALVNFWNGYEFRQMTEETGKIGEIGSKTWCDVKPHTPEGEYFMDGFEEFVYSHYRCEWTVQGWAKLIINTCGSDAKAFEKFFELLDEFMKQKND